MKFIEISGLTLSNLVNSDEVSPAELKAAGITDQCIIRINQQGDIEVRRASRWDVIGGLLGDFEARLKKATGLDWAEE